MEKESLYLDTSVPSAYYDKKVTERQKATIKFWNEILPQYEVYISEITIEELENTKDEILRKNLRKLIKSFKILKVNKEIDELAKKYVEHKIFSERYIDDALHVAIASFYGTSFSVSWNFEHLVSILIIIFVLILAGIH